MRATSAYLDILVRLLYDGLLLPLRQTVIDLGNDRLLVLTTSNLLLVVDFRMKLDPLIFLFEPDRSDGVWHLIVGLDEHEVLWIHRFWPFGYWKDRLPIVVVI